VLAKASPGLLVSDGYRMLYVRFLVDFAVSVTNLIGTVPATVGTRSAARSMRTFPFAISFRVMS